MENERYFELLAEKYPTQQAVCREIINLNAILNLPKGTEHFISDIHGEYEAFCHILNNCSGVIAEKAELVFKDTLSQDERRELCTLIYYPKEKLSLIKSENKNSEGWYRTTLNTPVQRLGRHSLRNSATLLMSLFTFRRTRTTTKLFITKKSLIL